MTRLDEQINFNYLSFGDFGHEYIVAATPTTEAGKFYIALQVLEDSVVTYKTDLKGTKTTFTSVSVSQGDVIYGAITEVNVVSGRVRAYKRG